MEFSQFRDFLIFVRVRLSFLLAFVGAMGFAIFNEPSLKIGYAFIASFLVCSGSCALNNKTDVEEDRINKRRVAPIVTSRISWLVIAVLLLTGFFFASLLSEFSILLYTLVVASGLLYSPLRLKRYTLVKNFNSGFVLPLLFIMGAGLLNLGVFLYYFEISLFIFAISVVSDLRDYEGDRKMKLQTLAVRFSYNFARNTVYLIMAAMGLILFSFQLEKIFFFLPFMLAMVFFLAKNRPLLAHTAAISAFLGVTAYAIIV